MTSTLDPLALLIIKKRDFIFNLRKKSKKQYVPSENYNATTEASNNAQTINHLNFRGTRIAGSNCCTK